MNKKLKVLSVSIKTYDFRHASHQINMFDTTDYGKLQRTDRVIDQIRHRYGIDSIKRAAFIKSRIDHMEGGVSREKRTVDYTKLKIE